MADLELLTPRQREIYSFIRSKIQGRGYGPTVREIGLEFDIKSPNGVMCHLKALQKKGLIHREPNMSRAIQLLDDPATAPAPHYGVKLIGRIAAGSPIEAISDPSDAVELGDDFAAEDAYALRVRGKSMIEDLIDDGDLVVVQPAQTAQNGEVVVALLNSGGSEHGEVTLKRYYRERDHIRLQPANQTMQPIIVRPEDVQVQGKVIALIRRI